MEGDSVPVSKKTYKVVSATGFRGHAEGETFEAELPPELERRAKARGSIRVVTSDTKKKEASDG